MEKIEKKVRPPLPPFKGQYSDEKVLFNIKENIINFIFKKIYILISLLIFSAIFSGIIYFFLWIAFFIISIIFFIILIFIYYYIIYKNTNFIFTTRRIIKDVKNGLFSKHRKELKILDIKSSTASKNWFFQTILMIWNVKVEWTENNASIHFYWIKEYSQISNYIWRVIDHIKLNWHTDDIARYQDKKYRKRKNTNRNIKYL